MPTHTKTTWHPNTLSPWVCSPPTGGSVTGPPLLFVSRTHLSYMFYSGCLFISFSIFLAYCINMNNKFIHFHGYRVGAPQQTNLHVVRGGNHTYDHTSSVCGGHNYGLTVWKYIDWRDVYRASIETPSFASKYWHRESDCESPSFAGKYCPGFVCKYCPGFVIFGVQVLLAPRGAGWTNLHVVRGGNHTYDHASSITMG